MPTAGTGLRSPPAAAATVIAGRARRSWPDAYAPRLGETSARLAMITPAFVNVAGMSDLTASRTDPRPRTRWGWFVALGIAQLVLGIIAWFDVIAFTIAGVIFLGALVLVAGVFQIVHAFMDRAVGWVCAASAGRGSLRDRWPAADGRSVPGRPGDHHLRGGGADHRRHPAHRHRRAAPAHAGMGTAASAEV